MTQAGQIPGMRAFLNIGPRVTTGKTTSGKVTQEVPYEREFSRYAQLLGGASLPTYAALTPTDLDGSHGECTLIGAFGGFGVLFFVFPRFGHATPLLNGTSFRI